MVEPYLALNPNPKLDGLGDIVFRSEAVLESWLGYQPFCRSWANW